MMREDRKAPTTGPASNVIAMNRHRTDARFPHVAMIESYWHALRGHRIMPNRADVDPRGIEQSLEYAFILEQVAPGVGRMRIAGAHLGDLLGMEVRGMPLSALFVPEARDDLAACLDMVCAAPTIATLSLQAEAGMGKPLLEARLLLLPMKDETGEINRILGCLDSNGSIGRAPRRFTIMSRRLTQITGHDVARGWDRPSHREGGLTPLRGFADTAGRFTGHGETRRAGRTAPHLRLVAAQGEDL